MIKRTSESEVQLLILTLPRLYALGKLPSLSDLSFFWFQNGTNKENLLPRMFVRIKHDKTDHGLSTLSCAKCSVLLIIYSYLLRKQFNSQLSSNYPRVG